MYAAENARFAAQIKVPVGVFSSPTVTLELPPGASAKPGAAAAFMLAANLLSRIFTKLHLVGPDLPVGPNAWGIETLSELVDPLSDISEGYVSQEPPEHSDIVVGVGRPPTISAAHSTFFSFSGWDAALEIELTANEPGPIGALFSACYGTAQAFIFAARLAGAHYRPVRPFQLSLLNYQETGPAIACPGEINVRDAHLVGIGAVGSALIYSLAHFPSLKGVLNVVDNDSVDLTNLNRYILMRKADAVNGKPGTSTGTAKVDVAVHALAGREITIHPFEMSFAEFRTSHQQPIDLLITPVDSELSRRKLASHLPRMVLNAATGHTTVTISRHFFADGKACLACLYLPDENELTTEKRLANDLGISLADVEEHLANNRPVTAGLARQIEASKGLPPGSLSPSIGQHLQSLYQRAVCGQAAIQTPIGTVVSPLSFISAAAGVMLAAELAKESFPELSAFALDNYFRIDTLFSPNPDFRTVKPQESTHRCICWDKDYQAVYRRRFPA